MLLRTRVTIIVGLALLVLGGGLFFAGQQRDELAASRFADATLTGQETFWHKLVENVAQRLEADAVRLAADARLVQAMAAHDSGQTAVALGRSLPKSGRGLDIRAAATGKNGTQLATTLDRLSGTLLDGGALAHVLETNQPLLGVQVAEDRSIWIAATAPARLGGEAVGAVTLAVPLDEAVREFKGSTGADLLVVNRTGALAAGTNQIFWPQVQQEVQLGKRQLFTLETGGRFMAVGTTKLYDGMRRYGGTLVTTRDITASHTREHDIAVVSAVAAGLFFGMIVLGFYLYLQHSFDPLKEAIQVLEAMSRGDTSKSVRRGRGGDDEIGRIASTVELFRAGMIEQELQEVRRQRQRRWQERFVRNQLAELCTMLDEPARSRAEANLHWTEGEEVEGAAADHAHHAQLGPAPKALAAVVAEFRAPHLGEAAASEPASAETA